MHSPARAAGASSCVLLPFPEGPRRLRSLPTTKTFSEAAGPGERSRRRLAGGRAGGAGGRLPADPEQRGRAGGFGKGLRLSVLPSRGMSQPRAALLRHRPPLSPVFPASGRRSSSRLKSASKEPRSRAPAAATTPSGRVEGNRAGRRKGGGQRAELRRRSAQARGARARSRVRGVHAGPPALRCLKV